MPGTRFHLRYGSGSLPLEVPTANLQGVLEPREAPGVRDEVAAVTAELQAPIGSPRLADLVQAGDRVVVVVSDVTRPAPTAKMLPPLLAELRLTGVRDADVTVVFALGIHRSHSRQEQIRLVGQEVFERVRCVDFNPEDCVYLGTTQRGTPLLASRTVVEADFRICTGNVEYHYFAGYSGGAKALVPGVCHRSTVERNHAMMLLPGAVAGRLADNPVRQDIEEAAERVGVDFALNTVLNARGQIVRVVAGEQRAALAAAAAAVDEIYQAPVDELADVVVASAGGYPKDISMYQAQKAIDNARFAVRKGGIIILAAECHEGLGEETFANWMHRARTPGDLIEWLRARFVLGGHKAAALAIAVRHADVHLVSTFPEDYARRLFFEPVASPQVGLARALDKLGSNARVLVMPNAGSTLPRLLGGSG